MKYHFSPYDRRKISNQDAQTPQELYQQLDSEFHFDFDPCPNSPSFNGLEVEWGRSNYVNPPYSDKVSWIKKAIQESRKGKLAVMLLPVDTSTKWFHDLILRYSDEIRFIKGRLRFTQYDAPAKFASMIIVFYGRKGLEAEERLMPPASPSDR